ncbi:MAG: G5 domain-containing protein [Christensenella sp.]
MSKPKRKRDIDLDLHPDTKYKGILYTGGSRRTTDDDLLRPTRAKNGQARKKNKLREFFGSLSFFHVTRAKASDLSSRTEKPAAPSAVNTTGSDSARNSGKRAHAQGGGKVLRSANRPKSGGFFHDHLLRTTGLICAAVIAVSLITVQTTLAKPGTAITLIDNGREMQCETLTQTVGEFLNENGVVIDDADILSTEKDVPIYEGQVITIYRAVPLTVRSNTQTTDVSIVAGHTVADVLAQAGIVPAENDEVYPSPDTIVRSGMVIDHIVVTTAESKETRPIPFENTTKQDATLPKGEHKVVQEGQEGVLQITYTQLFKNGVLISQDSISEDVIQKPVDQVMAIGTYVKPEPKKETPKKTPPKKTPSKKTPPKKGSSSSDSSNQAETDLNGRKAIKMQVTAYCSNCNSGSKTSMGTYPQWGTLACNSLPFGTRVYIEGYGEGVVEDRGGMGGNVIDIYMGDQANEDTCNAWGRKTMTVYIIN